MTTQPSDWAVARAFDEACDTVNLDKKALCDLLNRIELRARELDASGGGMEPLAWIHEDELPEGYPYDAMFPYSKVDIVRMFPVYGPRAAEAGDTELLDWFSGGIDRHLYQCPTGEWCAQDDVILACYGDTPREAILAAIGAVGATPSKPAS